MSSIGGVKLLMRIFLGLDLMTALAMAFAIVHFFTFIQIAYIILKFHFEQPRSYYTRTDGRGDELMAKTNFTNRPPFVTAITLTRAGGHSPTTLAMVTSKTFWAALKWRDDDHAEVVMHVDETGRMIQLRPSVGSIQFHYSLIKEAEQTHPPGYFSWGFLWYIKRTF